MRSCFSSICVATIVVNLREMGANKLMKKTSLLSHGFFQFSPHNFNKAPGFSVEKPVLLQQQVTDCMGETTLKSIKIVGKST